jgi:cytochrome c553
MGDLPSPPYNNVVQLRLPDSQVTHTQAQLFDQFAVPDWHPKAHPPMPPVVAHGRKPDVYACGYCHLSTGLGRPENATLAGLPVDYIVQQIANFKSGARRTAWPQEPYGPTDGMVQVAQHLAPADVQAAAKYFSGLKMTQRSKVTETLTIPKPRVAGWTYVPAAGGGTEPLGARLIEMAPDARRDELRDDEMQYIAYVPPGSIARGKAIATTGAGETTPCVACHGADLKGMATFPPIAGRSATYILRQLYAFKTGTRKDAAAQAMHAVVGNLSDSDMIAASAFVASRNP